MPDINGYNVFDPEYVGPEVDPFRVPAWVDMCNQEKFDWLKRRLDEVQASLATDSTSIYSLQQSLRQHRHAPDGEVMVKY